MPNKNNKTQSEGLKAWKETRRRNKTNAILWAKLRLVNNVDRIDVVAGVMERYGYTESYASELVKKAENLATSVAVQDMEVIINKNLARLDAIAEAAADGDDYQNAIKAIDTLNKMSGAYVDKKEVEIKGNEIRFTFGNEDNNI